MFQRVGGGKEKRLVGGEIKLKDERGLQFKCNSLLLADIACRLFCAFD